jgi:hypothetical protein
VAGAGVTGRRVGSQGSGAGSATVCLACVGMMRVISYC